MTDNPKRQFNIPLDGRLFTSVDPAQIGKNFRKLQNMRYIGQGTNPRGIPGMEKIGQVSYVTPELPEVIDCPGISATVLSVPIVESQDDLFVAYDNYGTGYACKCTLSSFYDDYQRYVVADAGFHTSTVYPAETNRCEVIVPDYTGGYVYLLTEVKYTDTRRIFKLNYTDMTWVADAVLATTKWKPYDGFLWDDYLIITTTNTAVSPQSILKVRKSDLTIVGTIVLSCATYGNTSYYYPGSGSVAWFTQVGSIAYVNLDTFTTVGEYTDSGRGEHSVASISSGIIADGTSVLHPFTIVSADCNTEICVAGASNPAILLTLVSSNMNWGWHVYYRDFSVRYAWCCDAFGACDETFSPLLTDVFIPWLVGAEQYTLYCKTYNSSPASGIYGAAYGWIEVVTFSQSNPKFICHQVCEPT